MIPIRSGCSDGITCRRTCAAIRPRSTRGGRDGIPSLNHLLGALAILLILASGARAQTYYAFMFGDQKAGYQVVEREGHTRTITTKFVVNNERVDAVHKLTFNDDGSLKSFSADGGPEVLLSTFTGIERPYPTSAYEEIIRRMTLQPDARYDYTAVLDGTGEVLGPRTFVVEAAVQWTNPVTHAVTPVLKIVEYDGAKPQRHFLVDERLTTHLAYWQGPQSILVGSKEEALRGLAFE